MQMNKEETPFYRNAAGNHQSGWPSNQSPKDLEIHQVVVHLSFSPYYRRRDTSFCGFSFHYFLQACVNNLNCTLDTGLVNYYNEQASKRKSVWLFEETERGLLVGCRYLMLITLFTVQFQVWMRVRLSEGRCRVSSKADLFYLIDQGEKYPEVISAS